MRTAIGIYLLITSLNVYSASSDEPKNTPGTEVSQAASSSNPIQTSSFVMQPTLQLSNDELYLLQKLRIQKELEDDISKWIQTRFWFIALASILVGFVGVRALVREFVSAELKDAMRSSAEAQSAANLARDSVREVRAEAGKYKDLVDAASDKASLVNDQLQELKSRIDAEGARSVAVSEIKTTALSAQLEELRNTVTALAADSERNRAILKTSGSRIDKARETAQATEAEFFSNTNIDVRVVSYIEGLSKELGSEVQNALASLGFKVSASPWGKVKGYTNNIRVCHQPNLLQKAELVSETILKILKSKGVVASVKLESKMNPIGNSSANIAVFFE